MGLPVVIGPGMNNYPQFIIELCKSSEPLSNSQSYLDNSHANISSRQLSNSIKEPQLSCNENAGNYIGDRDSIKRLKFTRNDIDCGIAPDSMNTPHNLCNQMNENSTNNSDICASQTNESPWLISQNSLQKHKCFFELIIDVEFSIRDKKLSQVGNYFIGDQTQLTDLPGSGKFDSFIANQESSSNLKNDVDSTINNDEKISVEIFNNLKLKNKTDVSKNVSSYAADLSILSDEQVLNMFITPHQDVIEWFRVNINKHADYCNHMFD
jgi:hypothetical protein